MMRAAVPLLIVLSLLGTGVARSAGTPVESRIRAEQVKIRKIHARLHQKRAQLRAATVRVGNLKAQVARTNAAIVSVSAHLSSLAAAADSTQRRLAWNTLQLRAAQKTLQLHDRLLAKRLVDIYEHGDDLGYVNVMLSATSFSDFVERWQDLRLLIAANERAVRERKAAAARVTSMQERIEATQAQLQAQIVAQAQAKTQLDALAQERRNLLGLADAQRRHVAGEVAEMEGLSATEEANLEALIRQREAEIAAQERAQGIVGPSTAGAGMFSWPVVGPITSPFGWRRNPFGGAPEFHQGLDIAAPMGTTVEAPAAGTVIMAQWYGGYGNYILIDHGGGISTGYGHLSVILVSVGQKVQKGQAIGEVGSTGDSTGPHLHFEVRVNGKPVDPTPYLH